MISCANDDPWQKTLTAAVNVIIINDCTFQWLRQINSSAPGQSFLIWPDAVDAAGICPFLSTLTWFVEVTSKQMLQRNIVKTLCHNKVGNIIGYYWKMDAQHLRIHLIFHWSVCLSVKAVFSERHWYRRSPASCFSAVFLYTLQVQFTEANEKEKETPTVLLWCLFLKENLLTLLCSGLQKTRNKNILKTW